MPQPSSTNFELESPLGTKDNPIERKMRFLFKIEHDDNWNINVDCLPYGS